ncbi:hypothetical protein RP20_CCG020311 [Aedes albopictus]|nr:hypothetical protein RP20_CCG020311 [Aedes albopictus]
MPDGFFSAVYSVWSGKRSSFAGRRSSTVVEMMRVLAYLAPDPSSFITWPGRDLLAQCYRPRAVSVSKRSVVVSLSFEEQRQRLSAVAAMLMLLFGQEFVPACTGVVVSSRCKTAQNQL